MKNEDYALGKDSPYQSSIAKMSRALTNHGFDIEEVSWQNPVPNVWSVHIRDRSCPQLFTNGKGHSRDAALASALGEFHERLACDFFFGEYYFGSEFAQSAFVHHPREKWYPVETPFCLERIVPEELALFYDEARKMTEITLVDFNSGNNARGICALPFVRVADQQEVYFPVNILNNLYVSNGMAAGNSVPEARVQALSEIIERHVKNRIISQRIALPDVPENILNRYPRITTGIDRLQQEGFHILVKDASLYDAESGMGFPVINITLMNPADNGVFAAFGAHPIFEVALERTLTELLQGRSLDTLTDFPSPSVHVEEVANPRNLEMHFVDSTGILHVRFLSEIPDYSFHQWDFEGGTDSQYEYLVSLIHRMGRQIYVADYNHFGVYCCRIIVPGMSEIYPVEDLVLENKSQSVPVRNDVLSPAALSRDAHVALAEYMEEMSFPAEQPVFDLMGILPAGDSPWASLCVGEFNALLCLSGNNLDDALLWSDWCASSPLLSAERRMLFKCITIVLTIETDGAQPSSEYHSSLRKLFGEALFSDALRMIRGDDLFVEFMDFEYALKDGAAFAPHVALLDAYRKCQRAKANLPTE
jgi:ribosomal protein S12 methylthiotransferase accessory factor